MNWWRHTNNQKHSEPSYRALGMETPNKPSPFFGRKDAHSCFVELLHTRRVWAFSVLQWLMINWKTNWDMQATAQAEPGFVMIYVKQVCSLFYIWWIVEELSKLYLSLLIRCVSNAAYVWFKIKKLLFIFKYFYYISINLVTYPFPSELNV